MDELKILKFAKSSIFDTVERIGKWNGFEVWEPGSRIINLVISGFHSLFL